jgi:hypothetical protein
LCVTGGTYKPPNTKKKSADKVVRLVEEMYSVHSNKMYRTVCHVPPGENLNNSEVKLLLCRLLIDQLATCSLKACLASKELSERNNVEFSCSHIEDVAKFVATAPQEELTTDECRYYFINSYLIHTFWNID